MNTPISTLEIAKLLKTKGFDKECRLCMEDGDERPLPFNCGNTLHRNSLHPYYSAPTITEVVMWLYTKYKIWISVQPNIPYDDDDWVFILFKDLQQCEALEGYSSSDEAYESAIKYVLEKLI